MLEYWWLKDIPIALRIFVGITLFPYSLYLCIKYIEEFTHGGNGFKTTTIVVPLIILNVLGLILFLSGVVSI